MQALLLRTHFRIRHSPRGHGPARRPEHGNNKMFPLRRYDPPFLYKARPSRCNGAQNHDARFHTPFLLSYHLRSDTPIRTGRRRRAAYRARNARQGTRRHPDGFPGLNKCSREGGYSQRVHQRHPSDPSILVTPRANRQHTGKNDPVIRTYPDIATSFQRVSHASSHPHAKRGTVDTIFTTIRRRVEGGGPA